MWKVTREKPGIKLISGFFIWCSGAAYTYNTFLNPHFASTAQEFWNNANYTGQATPEFLCLFSSLPVQIYQSDPVSNTAGPVSEPKEAWTLDIYRFSVQSQHPCIVYCISAAKYGFRFKCCLPIYFWAKQMIHICLKSAALNKPIPA